MGQHRKVMKFGKGECKVQNLGRNKSIHQHMLNFWYFFFHFSGQTLQPTSKLCTSENISLNNMQNQ